MLAEQVEASIRKRSSASTQRLPRELIEIQLVPVRSLLPADSPRQAGVDLEHTRMLAGIDERLPPIIVHRSTMRVIDGAHRLGAALLRGDEMIEVRFFDG